MRWEDERYVRVYTRDTGEWLALGWEAQALFLFALRKADRAGIVRTGKAGARGLAGMTGIPLDVVTRSLPLLLEDGCMRECDGGYIIPNFIAAQEVPISDAQRKRDQRERDRDKALANGGVSQRSVADIQAEMSRRTVTPAVTQDGHACCHAGRSRQTVTSGHAGSVTPNRAVPVRSDPSQDLPPPAIASAAEQAGLPGIGVAPHDAQPNERKRPAKARKAPAAPADAPGAPESQPAPFKAACDMLCRVYSEVRKADYGFSLNATRNGKAVRELLWGDGAKGRERGEPLVPLEEVERRWRIGLAWKGFPACNAIWDLREHWAAYAQPQGAQRTRQQEIWEGLQERRRAALEAVGQTCAPELATADYINTALARWKDTKKGDDTEELTALGAAFIHFCEDQRYLGKGLPVKLFLSPGVFAECEAKDKANLHYIADLRAPGIR